MAFEKRGDAEVVAVVGDKGTTKACNECGALVAEGDTCKKCEERNKEG